MLIEEPLLGTRGEVSITTSSPADANQAELAVFAEVRRLEKIFTVFDESSELHDLRRTGSTTVAELETVIDLAIDWRRRTDGAFHPAMHPLVDLWEAAAAERSVPSADALAATVDQLARSESVRFGAGLELNGIAKGWIADRALGASGIGSSASSTTSGWLSLGGDLVHRGEGSVVVGIEDPLRPYDNVEPMATVEISGEALATSGGGRRWWDIDGVRYSKVLDPRTGQPAERILSATVVAPTATAADVLATTCLVLEIDEILERAAREEFECFLVVADGRIVSSSDRFRRAQASPGAP